MNVFEKMGLKLINNRSGYNDNLIIVIGKRQKNGKTVYIHLSDQLITELGWENVDRVSLFSDGHRIMALTTPIEGENTYKLIHVSNNKQHNKKVVKFTWKNDIIEDPKYDIKESVKYETDLDEVNDRFGIKMYLPSNFFEEN